MKKSFLTTSSVGVLLCLNAYGAVDRGALDAAYKGIQKCDFEYIQKQLETLHTGSEYTIKKDGKDILINGQMYKTQKGDSLAGSYDAISSIFELSDNLYIAKNR